MAGTGGFGGGPWGGAPWGGSLSLMAPPPSLFDIFCYEGAGMLAILLDVNVSATPFGDFSFNGDNDLVITSNDNSEAFLLQSSSVPANYTLEVTLRPEDLPSNFGDITNHHAFIGVVDISGFAAGLFFSDAGLAYGGAFATGDHQTVERIQLRGEPDGDSLCP